MADDPGRAGGPRGIRAGALASSCHGAGRGSSLVRSIRGRSRIRASGGGARPRPLGACGAARRLTASPRGREAAGGSGRASSSSVACVLGVQSRVFRNTLETRASNVGPTPSRRGKTDVRPSGPAQGVAKRARSAQGLRAGAGRARLPPGPGARRRPQCVCALGCNRACFATPFGDQLERRSYPSGRGKTDVRPSGPGARRCAAHPNCDRNSAARRPGAARARGAADAATTARPRPLDAAVSAAQHPTRHADAPTRTGLE